MSISYLHLAQKANEDKGFTYNLSQEKFIATGFAVGAFSKLEKKIFDPILDPRHIADYINKNVLDLLPRNSCLGAWYDGTAWYLDVSYVVPTIQEAAGIARKNNQLAIYDLDKKETIYLAQIP